MIINILLIATVGYVGVKIFNTLSSPNQHNGYVPENGPQNVSSAINDISPPYTYYNAIIERNLFQSGHKKKTNSNDINIETLKQTRLNLKLWGTVTGAHGKTYAVIEQIKGGGQNLYMAGDTLQDAVVKMILREKVIFCNF